MRTRARAVLSSLMLSLALGCGSDDGGGGDGVDELVAPPNLVEHAGKLAGFETTTVL